MLLYRCIFLVLIPFSYPLCLPALQPAKICCIDCHGVLVAKKPWALQKNVGAFLMRHHYHLLPLLVTPGPRMLHQKWQNIPFSLEQVLQDYPDLQPYYQELYELLRLEDPFEGTVRIIKKLKKHGFSVILTSNLSPLIYAYNKKQYPELFTLFDLHRVAPARKPVIKKSEKEYFIQLREEFNKQFQIDITTPILLIDDNPLYIAAAQEADVNIHTLHFENPEQLKKKLKEQGYL